MNSRISNWIQELTVNSSVSSTGGYGVEKCAAQLGNAIHHGRGGTRRHDNTVHLIAGARDLQPIGPATRF